MNNRKTRRRAQKKYRASLNMYSDNLELVTREDYRNVTGLEPGETFIRAYVSKKYLVQLYQEKEKPLRLSINRTGINAKREWEDNITWDEIQQIKNEIGFADNDCVEIYPAEKNIVNVANMRHIWVMPELLDFSWKDKT